MTDQTDTTELDLSFVEELVGRLGRQRSRLIAMLQALQDHYGYLPPEALERLCELTEITPADVAGVATFYDQFRHRPMGRYIIRVCHGTACHIKGAGLVHDALYRHLGIDPDDDTDPEGLFTVEKVACLGCCTLAPVVQIGEVTYGHMSPEKVAAMLRDFLELTSRPRPERRAGARPPGQAVTEIRLGLDSCCVARGSGRVEEALVSALAETAALLIQATGEPVRVVRQRPGEGAEPLLAAFRRALESREGEGDRARPRSLAPYCS